MKIRKRNGQSAEYRREKIERVIQLAFESVGMSDTAAEASRLAMSIEARLRAHGSDVVAVESIQDQVEESLMVAGHYEAAKNFILYRNERTRARQAREQVLAYFDKMPELDSVLKEIQAEFTAEEYALPALTGKFRTFCKSGQSAEAALAALIKAAAELTTRDAPGWEMIAARFWLLRFRQQLARYSAEAGICSLYDKMTHLTKEGVYGSYITAHYSKAEIDSFEQLLEPERDKLFNYSGLELLHGRYLIRTCAGKVMESPQEMFLGIAMHLAMHETEDRAAWVKRFYDMLSTLKVTMATPTLANARKPFHQLSSCFIDTVPDSLEGIYRSIDNFAQVSKYGGGMGLYFGKVRASGSAIRGFPGAAGGVIRWIRLANDTAVAVDQLGVRQGAVAVYLDAWHRDLPEFLSLRTNNGDDRLKAHDVFPAVCYPDYFWQQARDNIEGDWYLMCPHEIKCIKGYALEDSYGEEWEQRYHSCVQDSRIHKRIVPIKELIRLILKSAVETGTPFVFNRDLVNRANPNKHRGIIYCSNLCTEIAQNMSAIESISQTTTTVNGETVVVTTTRPGHFVVCNLASLSLGRIDVRNPQEVAEITRSAVRALDNVIDLNFYPLPYAAITNRSYRPIGLGGKRLPPHACQAWHPLGEPAASGICRQLVRANQLRRHQRQLRYRPRQSPLRSFRRERMAHRRIFRPTRLHLCPLARAAAAGGRARPSQCVSACCCPHQQHQHYRRHHRRNRPRHETLLPGRKKERAHAPRRPRIEHRHPLALQERTPHRPNLVGACCRGAPAPYRPSPKPQPLYHTRIHPPPNPQSVHPRMGVRGQNHLLYPIQKPRSRRM